MGITYQDDAEVTTYGTGSIAATIDVAAGDLIVVFIGVAPAGTWCTGVTDDIGNSYTVRTAIAANDCTLVFAYVLSSIGADATNVITATFNNSTAVRKNIIASCYEPDSGDVVTLEDSSNKASTYEASPWETPTDEINTTGDDELLIAGFQSGTTSITYTNHEIPSGIAAGGVFTGAYTNEVCFYRILTATLSNGEAEVDTNVSGRYCAEILAFKSVAGAGGGIAVLRRRRM